MEDCFQLVYRKTPFNRNRFVICNKYIESRNGQYTWNGTCSLTLARPLILSPQDNDSAAAFALWHCWQGAQLVAILSAGPYPASISS